MKKKRCFTFVEILGALAIISILTAAMSVGVNTIWQNNRIDICESELREMSAAFKSYFTDYSNIVIAPDANYDNVLNETVELLNTKYLPYEIKVSEIAADKKSATFETVIKQDPWKQKYRMNIYTYNGDDAGSIPGMIVISSNGADSVSNKGSYSSDDFGDDVIAVIEPN
ncbi:MAG: prepilin-type N-terminal cleavage/methylation domain-containing protein [Lachnospiraceae bacterium]|nr:prepilin-type N-terminal cleavage/methylation domain-containing protein [Lachnospiraceae bacterium]